MESLLGIFFLVVLAFLVGIWLVERRWVNPVRQLRTATQERNQQRDELRRVRLQLDWVTQSVEEGIILIDAAKQISFMNQVAQEILGNSAQYTLRDVARILEIQPIVQEVLEHHAESLGQTIDKDKRIFQVNVRRYSDNSERGAIIVLREVTELQRLGRVRRDFVANLSHELRTPVTSLQLLTETLEKELPPNVTLASELLAKLRGQVNVLRQLTDEMMDLALIESGQLPIKLVKTSVQALVTPVIDLLNLQAERKAISLTVAEIDSLSVLADSAGIQKVLSNIIYNAIKFTPEKGEIKVSARPRDDFVEFSITDNGVGIAAADLPRIFERFYKVDRARAPTGMRGTGLGLAIAKHIVEGHGGSIWVESIQDKGSTFHFTLPVVFE